MTIQAPATQAAAEVTPRRPVSALAAAWAGAAVVLFCCYWRLSWAMPANSDSAATALQAWDLLHGNLLLHGWQMSDVSFYGTEIPQYALLEAVFGLGAGVVHIAAALSYTLIVLLAAALAKGSSRGREGVLRAVLGGGIVAAPQLGYLAAAPTVSGAQIVMLGPDHTGTIVPVLATWLVIERCRPRWQVPVVVCLLLTVIMASDQVVLFTGIAPLVLAGLVRAARSLWRPVPRRGPAWYEPSLAAAAIAAAGLGLAIPTLIARLGGYHVFHFGTHLEPVSKLGHDAWDTVQGVLELFGADFVGAPPGPSLIAIWLHLAGVALAVSGFAIAVARFFREDGVVVPALAAAIALSLGAFLISVHSVNLLSVREIVAVAPLGAVLAGRTMAGPLLRLMTWLRPRARHLAAIVVAGGVAAGYAAQLGYDAAQPAVPSMNQAIAGWLEAHQLRTGLATYWEAGSVTLDTSGRVQVYGIVAGNGGVGPYYWESDTSDYNPAAHTATFVIAGGPAEVGPVPVTLPRAARDTFGKPDEVFHVLGYTILVWHENLLRHLGWRR